MMFFYMDSFSIFDIYNTVPNLGLRQPHYYNHIEYLKKMLQEDSDESLDLFDDKRNKKIISVEKRIEEIINGKIKFNKGEFSFISKNLKPCKMQNTASGIKQIGVIQLLLSNRKLKEDSFLIIDEPEVNLHPKWQFKLAEILTLLVCELNIKIYINSHSPLFIEAMEVFTKKYGLDEDTNYYMSEKSDNPDAYDIVGKYDLDNLYELYENLAEPYNLIDSIDLKI